MSFSLSRVIGLGLLGALGVAVGCARSELSPEGTNCPGAQTHCDGTCVDLGMHPSHCGACGRACAAGESCWAGHCESLRCAAGFRACGGACVNVASDRLNCGACGVVCAADAPLCRAGVCGSGDTSCLPPAVACGAECVSTNTDPRHCGACFAACPQGEACNGGRCDLTCVAGLSRCGAECVDLAFDPLHCGACDASCASDEACNAGRCEDRGCAQGLASCGTECADLDWDANHCGQCFNRCDSSASCISGICRCAELQTDCGGQCVFINANPDHCGSCDRACDAGEDCVGGECVQACGEPFAICDDACVNLDTDLNHCGSCGEVCSVSQRCVEGQCTQSCDWDVDAFPIEVDINATAVGDLTLDLDCNLYLGKQPGAVFRIDAQTREVARLATLETYVRGIVFRPEDGRLYFSSQDRVHRMELDGSDFVELDNTNVGQHLNGMTLAPTNWGEFAGHLILARSDGLVIAIDPDQPVPTVIAQLSPFISDVEFDGQTLYVAAFTEQRILQVEPNGQVTVFADAPCEPDGITVAPDSHLFVACGNTNELYAYGFSSGTWTLLSEAALNGLFAPIGLLWDGTDTLIVLEQSTDPAGSVLKGYDPW